MSPELLNPAHFGFQKGRPTKASDCYALGMVTLEVLSGKVPFAHDTEWIVMQKVLNCEHPERPEGPWFADDLWGILKQCWTTHPESRPSIEVVLECFVQFSTTWKPHSPLVGEGGLEAGEDTESDEGVVTE